ncbi:MAG: response regulator [Proteobacteria bacterium]|nr:response regulator [Pseudomonadota bacterium]
MTQDDLKLESLGIQWNLYERSVNNYSIIMRILNCLENKDGFIKDVPRIFVGESPFETCKILKLGNNTVQEGFFSLDNSPDNLNIETIKSLNTGIMSPLMQYNVYGYSALYIHPLKEDLNIIGFMVLGKKSQLNLDKSIFREIEIVCNIYNKALLLSSNFNNHKENGHDKNIFELVMNEFPNAMFLIDRGGSVHFANKRAREEFENRKNLFVGERLDNLIIGIDEDFYKKDYIFQGDVSYKSGDKFKIFKMNCFPVIEKQSKANWKAVVLTDVAEEKFKNEENLLKEKMGSIGLLAGGIAHDFNNLLTGILGYASLMKNFLPKDEKLFRYAEAIEHSAQRASKLTQHLLNFSRRQNKTTGIIDVNALLEDVLFLLKESFRDVEIEKSFYEYLPLIKGDEAELQNVFLNLCINAKDAMNGIGLLKVRTERRQQVGEKALVLIEVEDSGKGIDDGIKTRIFEPYFSTKENGKNLGMGLYIVSKVIRDHGGFIELDSKPGHGTKFSIYIPAAVDETWINTPAEEITKENINRKRRVLIVDDEDIIREFVKGILLDEGAQVIEASNGKEAIEIFKEHQHKIDLVILDMIMPGIKGDEVLREIRAMRPDIKVIVSSGFMSEEQKNNLKEYSVDAFLDKPYRDKDVIRTIFDILSN